MTSLAKNARYVRLWGSVTSSNLGDGIVLAAAPLAAAAITRDPLLITGVVVAQRIPWVLFSLVAGVAVDEFDRRLLLASANALRAAGMALFAVSLAFGFSHIVILYLAMFCMGTAETVADNASLALVPAVVDRAALERANGRIFAAMPIANEHVGPPVGGFLFAVASAVAFGAAASSYAAGAVLALMILGRYMPDGPRERTRLTIEVMEGLRWFVQHRIVRTAAIWAGTYNLFGAATAGVLVLVAQERLGLSDYQYGLLLACGAVGGITGGWLADRIVSLLGPGGALQAGTVLTAVAYGVIAATTNALIVGAMLALMSLATMAANVVAYTLRQTAIPDRLLGRVTAAYRLVGLGALPIGAIVGGLLARHFGLAAPFWVGSIGLVVLSIGIAQILTNPRIRATDLHAD